LQQHQPISAYPKSAVTQMRNLFRAKVELLPSVIDYDEVISGTLVFVELHHFLITWQFKDFGLNNVP
jgi:hypothetical protein